MHQFDVEECCNCGVVFGVPAGYRNNRRKDKKAFYCPNGHGQSYKESEADQLRRERDRLQQRLAQKDDDIKFQRQLRETAERSASAYKGQVTKLKRRAKAGMCPCCKRSFVNLARHMATKHADMDPEEPLKVIDGGKV